MATLTVTTAGETVTKTYAVPAAPGGRPTGAGYVAIEELGVGLDLRAALAKNLGGKKLTLPAAKFTGPDWNGGNDGVFSVRSTCTGIVGSGEGTIIGYPDSGFVGRTPITGPSGATNPMHTLQAIEGGFKELGNLKFQGNAGHLHGGARLRNDTTGNMHVHDIWMDDAAPGNSQSPPGETFGLNFWHVNGYLVEDVFIDGKGRGSAPLGNNSSRDAVYRDVKTKGNKYSSIAFWRCNGIELHDVTCDDGIVVLNLENNNGRIRIYNLAGTPNRAYRPNAIHINVHNELAPMKDFELHGFTVDQPTSGFLSYNNGALLVMIDDEYHVINQNNTQQVNPANLKFYQTKADGTEVLLTYLDADNRKGVKADPMKHWVRFH